VTLLYAQLDPYFGHFCSFYCLFSSFMVQYKYRKGKNMITISNDSARNAVEALKESIVDGNPRTVDALYRSALIELEDQLAGWKNSVDEIPPQSAIGERFVVRVAHRKEFKAVLIKCPNNGDDQLFTRLGSKEDDICFTSQVEQWRYDD